MPLRFSEGNLAPKKHTILKKYLFALIGFFVLNQFYSQLPDGSTAPNFNLNDINGNQQELYSYLNQGYSVILVFQGTWNAPGYSYHTSGVLDSIYAKHGPIGFPGVNSTTTDNVMVLMIEADQATTSADLNGTGSATVGDWVSGINYPIIDDHSMNQAYNLAWYPSIMFICPDKLIANYGIDTENNTYNAIETACFPPGPYARAELIEETTEVGICNSQILTYPVEVEVMNIGPLDLNDIEFEIWESGNLVNTYNWNGSITSYDTELINIGDFTTASPTDIEVVANTLNHSYSDTLDIHIEVASVFSPQFDVKIYTDDYPTETSWEIRESSGAVMASGGPYLVSEANTEVIQTVNLPLGGGCYDFHLLDANGNGMTAQNNPHGICGVIIQQGAVELMNWTDSTYLYYSDLTKFGTFQNLTTSVNEYKVEYNLFPNPSDGIVNIELYQHEEMNWVMTNLLGKELLYFSTTYGNNQIDVSHLPAGVYNIKNISNSNVQSAQLFIER